MSNIHAIMGNDEARVKEAALALAEKLTPPDAGEFGIEIVEGTAETSDQASRIVNEVLQALQTLPFFGGTKVVWLKNANLFADSVTGRAAPTIEAAASLSDFLKMGLPENVAFILSATDVDKRRTFYRTLGKLTKITVFDRPDTSRPGWEEDLMGLVARRAKTHRLRFDREALEFFIMLAGNDTRQIESELEKLDLYLTGAGAAERNVTVDEIRKLVSHSHTGIIFEIGAAISKKRLPQALERTAHLLHHGESAIGILLAAIVPTVRSLLVAKSLLERHRLPMSNFRTFDSAVSRLPADETASLPRKKDGSVSCYPVFLAAQDCGKFRLDDLKRGYTQCLEANTRLVTSQLEPRLVLDQLLTRLLT